MMIEIDDEARRTQTLARLGGIEDTVELRIGERRIAAVPELGDAVERTTAAGKTSAIHFFRFPLSAGDIERLREGGEEVLLSIGHGEYGHMAVLPPSAREALAADFA